VKRKPGARSRDPLARNGAKASFRKSLMPNDIPWWRRPGVHLRYDAHRWIRHDAARFVRPGFDPADVFPTLARKTQPAPASTFDDEIAAEIATARRVNRAALHELNEVRAELARRRALDAKYSPTQPRIPPGNPRGGQWTNRNGGQGTAQVIGQDAAQGDLASLTEPMGNVDIGDVSGSSELGDLFNIGPAETRVDGVQLAGDPPDASKTPSDDPPPKIPQRPAGGMMEFIRDAAEWVARNAVRRAPAVDAFFGGLNQIKELDAITRAIKSANDPAKTLEELQEPIGTKSQRGYEDHHIAEEAAARAAGDPESLIQGRDNRVRIPVLKHIEISRYYSTKVEQEDGTRLSPRDLLKGADFETRREFGLGILRKYGVLR
jgi:hypothetical protein